MRKQPSAASQQKICDAWNKKHPIGTPVTLLKDGGDLVDTVTTSSAQLMCGQPVIWLEGISGCYLLDRVTPRKEAEKGHPLGLTPAEIEEAHARARHEEMEIAYDFAAEMAEEEEE